jgi:tetratricopeptide (TPR) repeat protein
MTYGHERRDPSWGRRVTNPFSALGPRTRIALVLLLIIAGILVHQRLRSLDERFFGILHVKQIEPDHPAPGPPWPSLDFSLPALQGLAFYLTGNFAEAARAYRHHLQEHGALGDARDQSYVVLRRGDMAAAGRLAKAALAPGATDVEALLTLGHRAMEARASTEALAYFDRVLALRTDQFDALLLSSIVYARGGKYDQAIDALNRGLRQGTVEERRLTFLAALETAGELAHLPKERRPACLLAHYHRYLRIFDGAQGSRAVAYSEQAIAAGDRPDAAWVTIGVVANRRGKRQQALQAFLKATEVNAKNPDAFRWAAVANSDRGDLVAERRMWLAAVDAAPADPFYAELARDFLVEKLGDLPAALAFAEKQLAADPRRAENLRRMGEMYSSLGDTKTALAYLERAAQADPTNSKTFSWLGSVYYKLERTTDAEKAMRKAAALDPTDPGPHSQLASFYHHERRVREAIREYERALSMAPGSPEFLLGLCMLYDETQEYGRAVSCYRRVLAGAPGNPAARYRLPAAEQNFAGQRSSR